MMDVRTLQEEAEETAVVTSWTGIWITLAVSALQGAVFYAFFLWKRGKDRRQYESGERGEESNPNSSSYNDNEKSSASSSTCFDLYEPRQHAHMAPSPFGSWFQEAWEISDEDTLHYVGLDAFMFLRLLRLGARICALGSVLSLCLIPVYGTGTARGNATIEYNLLTLARVEQGSSWRLYVAVAAQWIFTAAVLCEFWNEWKLYAKNRAAFLTRAGDNEIGAHQHHRYAIRVEQVVENNTDGAVQRYFERLFPGKVLQATSCLPTKDLEALMDERQQLILKLESAVAFTYAKPDKPRPQIKVKWRQKVDAIEHYKAEIGRLNSQIDALRKELLPTSPLDTIQEEEEYPEIPQNVSRESNEESFEIESSLIYIRGLSSADEEVSTSEAVKDKTSTSTAFVTFTSLRAKQAALQCELSGDPDSMVVFPAADPATMLWQNVTVPLCRQRTFQFYAALFFSVGIVFWAVPVTFVTSVANLNSILEAFKVTPVDPNVAWYGLVAGLLPVVALAIFMALLFMAILKAATSFIRYKTWAEVDSYALFWHQLFQFANLWLILIGGSAFNQIDAILKDPGSIVNIVATALPGASTLFVNMITVSSLGAFGMELSMLPAHGVNLIMNLIRPEASRTQRQLDDAKKPPSIVWGKQVPPVIFIFLVSFLYMPIVPVIELFGLVYFTGSYMVYKHQCLHVYAQEFEGGGDATWQQVFGFLMACLYIGQVVFIAYMGLKEAPIQAGLGFVPLIVTVLVHMSLTRKLIVPLRNLSLEIAADVDEKEGELLTDGHDVPLYLQPALDMEKEERGPMPYRRTTVTAYPPESASV